MTKHNESSVAIKCTNVIINPFYQKGLITKSYLPVKLNPIAVGLKNPAWFIKKMFTNLCLAYCKKM